MTTHKINSIQDEMICYQFESYRLKYLTQRFIMPYKRKTIRYQVNCYYFKIITILKVNIIKIIQQSMKQTEELDQAPSVYKKQYEKWVNRHLSSDKAKCVSKNPALFVCVDKSCEIKCPFICSTRSCCCMKDHRKCTNLMNIDYFLQLFKIQKPHTKDISEKVQQVIDGLIDKLSQIKEKIVQQIEKGKASHLFVHNEEEQSPEITQLLQSDLVTGSLISQIVSTINQGTKEKIQSNVFENIVHNSKRLEKHGIGQFIKKVRSFIFDPVQEYKFFWDKDISNSYISINNRSISCNINDSCVRLCLISPALTSIKGRYVSWKIKITDHTSYIYLGIALRKIHENNKNEFTNYNSITNCYLISQDATTYAYNNPAQDNKQHCSFFFTENDIIQIQLDKVEWVLNFKNLRSISTTQLNVTHIPFQEYQSYHICVGFATSYLKSVEILPNIKSSYKDYEMQN